MEFEILPVDRHNLETYKAVAALCIAELGREHMVRERFDDQVYGAFMAGNIVGMAQVYENDRNEGSEDEAGSNLYIAKLAVARGFQGQRVDARLIEYIIGRATDWGYATLSTCAITDGSEEFFSTQGFVRRFPEGDVRDMSRSLLPN